MTQPDLFGLPERRAPIPRARRTDPATSHAAAIAAQSTAESHRDRIDAFMRQAGTRGATVDEIAAGTGLTAYQVSKRVPELARLGLAATNGDTRPSASGRAARVWRAVA